MGQRRAIVDALRSFQHVGFDTPVFVYHIEQSSRWAATSTAALEAMVDGSFAGMTSILTQSNDRRLRRAKEIDLMVLDDFA